MINKNLIEIFLCFIVLASIQMNKRVQQDL